MKASFIVAAAVISFLCHPSFSSAAESWCRYPARPMCYNEEGTASLCRGYNSLDSFKCSGECHNHCAKPDPAYVCTRGPSGSCNTNTTATFCGIGYFGKCLPTEAKTCICPESYEIMAKCGIDYRNASGTNCPGQATYRPYPVPPSPL